MGAIPSVSLPAKITCEACGCWQKCYAAKIERLRPSVREAYKKNLEILNSDPTQYWNEVEASVKMSRFFRFHVSGDIPNEDYLIKMIELASRNQHTEILCFTKRYGIVNKVISELDGNKLPDNLHLILSGWKDYAMNNPYNLPEAHVFYKDGTTTASESAKTCGGNCTECAMESGGCWTLKNGEQIVFNEH